VSALVQSAPAVHHLSAPDGSGSAAPIARAYLAPGHLFASAEDVQVTTILGSGVAVCIWDPQAEVGGMDHFLLPSGRPASPRFGDSAVALLIGRLLELGAHRSRMSAKVFGGAGGLEAFRADEWSLGARNVAMAREQLAAASIPVVEEDVGGDLARKLIFQVRTGAAWVRTLEGKA
jgi:chemotaxis protein CheD